MSAESPRPHVAIAVFSYRHEAEFAAGFLTDAGIPCRVQADDAAGMSLASPVKLWVRAEHADEALDLIQAPADEAPDGLDGLEQGQEWEEPVEGLFVPAGKGRGSEDEESGRLAPGPDDVAPRPSSSAPDGPARSTVRRRDDQLRLTGVERGLSAVGSAAALAGWLSLGSGTPWAGDVELVPLLLLVLAVLLALGAATGRVWGPLRSILRALSGSAP